MARSHGYVGVQSRGVIALPREPRKRTHLDQPGAQVETIERDDCVLAPSSEVSGWDVRCAAVGQE